MNVRQRALFSLVLSAAALMLASRPVSAGGWVVATVDELPGTVLPGEELVISFMMRQHGVHPANWGEMPLTFTHVTSKREITVSAPADPETLRYTARVTLPEPGLWRWIVGDGFAQPMGTINAPFSKTFDTWDSGRELFLAKGCVVCHTHAAVAELRAETLEGFEPGPDLSDFPAVPEYLRLWLADPRAVRPDAQMPDLELNDTEIEALIQFLSTE